MPVTYTNRRGVTYTLRRANTKTGRDRYFFAKAATAGVPCDAIPSGYEISESVNGIVSLIKVRPRLIAQTEAEFVEQMLAKHPEASKYSTFVRSNRIDIYELLGPSAEELRTLF